MNSGRRLSNPALGACLTASGTTLTVAECVESPPESQSQMWAFHLQPYDWETYVNCASENGFCGFSGTKSVRYGTATNATYRTLSNGTACNNTVFGDPAPGFVKQCSIGPNGFTFCSNQNVSCSFSGTKLVAYGANGNFHYRVLFNGAGCNDGVFGDPAVGVQKACYLQN